jgi:uncharacterized membrane protein YcaP (DUF421 family)
MLSKSKGVLDMTLMHLLNDINSGQGFAYASIRSVIAYLYSVCLIRYAIRAHLGTAIDFVLVVLIGAALGGSLYGGGITLVSSLMSATVIVLMHKLLAIMSFISVRWGKILKGHCHLLYKSGEFCRKTMRSLQITESDIIEECRKQLQSGDLDAVKEIRLERTGNITFTKKHN